MPSHQHQHGQHEAGTDADAAMAELLDLDAEVMHSYLSDLTAWIRQLAADPPPRRILDLGSGTGTGTFALLERFDQAEVIALDVSAAMLHRLSGKAAREFNEFCDSIADRAAARGLTEDKLEEILKHA